MQPFYGAPHVHSLNFSFNVYKESKEQCTCIKMFQLFEIMHKQSKLKTTFTIYLYIFHMLPAWYNRLIGFLLKLSYQHGLGIRVKGWFWSWVLGKLDAQQSLYPKPNHPMSLSLPNSHWTHSKSLKHSYSLQIYFGDWCYCNNGCFTCGLAIYMKKYLKAKEELQKLKYSPCKDIIFKNSSKRNQNPSRYIITL
jgi:hypothetical protein